MLASGSAIASLVTQFTMAFLQIMMVQKVFRFRINYPYLFTLLIFIAGVISLNILSRCIHIHWSFLPAGKVWLGNFALMLFSTVILAIVLRLWSFGAFLKILREDH
jgi:hypothetical protein